MKFLSRFTLVILTVRILFLTTSLHAQILPYGEQIGTTYYDLVVNWSTPNRIAYNEDDQSVSVVWTASKTAQVQPASERGVGYNHKSAGVWQYGTDGECPTKNHGCSNEYAGWPEIVNLPGQLITVNNSTKQVKPEIVLSHSGGLKTMERPQRGTGNWGQSQDLGFDQDFCKDGYVGLWPRMVGSGNNYLHALYAEAGSSILLFDSCTPHTTLRAPFFYARSSDRGENWDIQNVLLPGMQDTSLFSLGLGDQYAISAKDNIVAVLVGYYDKPWVLWKSIDNGSSWTTRIIKEFDGDSYELPNYFFNGNHGKYVPDNANALVIDDFGNIHCFAGRRIIEIDSSSHKWTGTAEFEDNGILYWNDRDPGFCEPAVIAKLVDYVDATGTPHSSPIYSDNPIYDPFDYMALNSAEYFLSSTSMPSVAVMGDHIYVTYSADVEGTMYGGNTPGNSTPFRDLYLVWSNDGGKTWSYELNISSDIAGYDDGTFGTGLEEDIFPSVAHRIGSDSTLHIMWNLDYEPGSNVRHQTGQYSLQTVAYYGVDVNALTFNPKTDVLSGINLSHTDLISFSDTTLYAGDTLLITPLLSNVNSYSFDPYLPFYDTTIIGFDTTIVDLNLNADSILRFQPSNTSTYTFTSIQANGCLIDTIKDSITVQLIGGGRLEAIILDDTLDICAGDSVQLEGFGSGLTGNYHYLWNDNNASATNLIWVKPSINQWYHLTVTEDSSGLIETDSIFVSVHAIPTLSVSTDQTICTGASSTLTASGNATSYIWSNGIMNGVPFSPSTSQSYTVQAINQWGCNTTDSVQINLIPFPNAAYTFQFNGLNFSSNNTSQNSDSWSWIVDDTQLYETENISHLFPNTGYYNICLLAHNSCFTDTLCDVLVVSLGLDDDVFNQGSLFKIYPNPATNTVLVDFETSNQFKSGWKLTMKDVTGKTVVQHELTQTSNLLDLTILNKGLYLYQIIHHSGISENGKISIH